MLKLVSIVRRLDYPDLRDILDILAAEAGKEVRRHGIPPIDEIKLTDDAKEALDLIRAESGESRQVAIELVQSLFEALSPVSGREGGRGYIESKKGYYTAADGTTVEHGPYAYLRYWETGGGRDKKGRRLRSVYLGKSFHYALEDGLITQDEILDAFHSDTLPALKERIQNQIEK